MMTFAKAEWRLDMEWEQQGSFSAHDTMEEALTTLKECKTPPVRWRIYRRCTVIDLLRHGGGEWPADDPPR